MRDVNASALIHTYSEGALLMHLQIIDWPQGHLTATWSEHGLCKLNFGAQTSVEAKVTPYDAVATRGLAAAVAEYFAGGQLDFPLAHFDWTGIPEFHRRVLERCARIPRGQIMTYGSWRQPS